MAESLKALESCLREQVMGSNPAKGNICICNIFFNIMITDQGVFLQPILSATKYKSIFWFSDLGFYYSTLYQLELVQKYIL